VNAVVENKGKEGVSTHLLTSNTSKASAPEPSKTPTPTPEPSKTALPASADTGSSVVKIGAAILSVIVVCYGCYKLLYRFADIKPISVGKLNVVKSVKLNYAPCYLQDGHLFSVVSGRYIDEIPFKVKGIEHLCFYIPNPSKLKPLLRKIFGIKVPTRPIMY
jgi:hypothetical protein